MVNLSINVNLDEGTKPSTICALTRTLENIKMNLEGRK